MMSLDIVNVVESSAVGNYSANLAAQIVKNRKCNIIDTKIPQKDVHGNLGWIKYLWKSYNFVEELNKNSLKRTLHLPTQELGRYVSHIHSKYLILTVHDIIPLELCQPFSKASRFLRKLDSRGIKKADHIIAVSEYTKNDLVNKLHIPEEKISVVYYGLNHNLFNFKKSDENDLSCYGFLNKPFILYVGSMQPRKNVSTLLKVFYRLKKDEKYRDFVLVIVGKSGVEEYKKQTLCQVKKLELSRDVIFTDFIPHSQLPAIYSSALVFVFPSIYEGFGIPPLEAMACGTAVVASNATSIPEVVGEAGILVNPFDVPGFERAIKKVLDDEGLRRELIKKGLIRAKKFTWEKMGEETLRAHDKIIS